MDSNHDIVPTLRMFNGVMMDKAADEIEALRAEVARLKAAQSPAKVPDAVMRALDRMSTPLHDSWLSGLTAELDAANIKTIRDYVLSGASPAKVGGDEREAFEAAYHEVFPARPLLIPSVLSRDGDDYQHPNVDGCWKLWRKARAALSADGGDKRDAERYRLIRSAPTTVMRYGGYLSGQALDAQCDAIAANQAKGDA